MRLDKFICKSTELTRAEAMALVNAGEVLVNAEVVINEATQVHENNTVTIDGQELTARASRYIMMHKPLDTVCSNIDEVYPSVFNYIDVDNACDLHIAGRLDADTTGLVLASDDGRWSYNIITPKKQCEKIYQVELRDPIAADVVSIFEQGVQLQGEKSLTLPAKLDIVSPQKVLLTITEGKHHQVKRMFAAVGNRVVALHRQKIGGVSLDIGLGQWRYLTADEIGSF
ncbi:MAG: pseudouridine synthase [Motiliproteus sp.]